MSASPSTTARCWRSSRRWSSSASESITQFEAGGRADLVAKEQAEIALLKEYLPTQLTPEEIEALISAAIAKTGAASIKDMGKVMGALKSELAGRADMGAVSARIKQKLG